MALWLKFQVFSSHHDYKGTDTEMNSSIHTTIFKIHHGLMYLFIVVLEQKGTMLMFLINNTLYSRLHRLQTVDKNDRAQILGFSSLKAQIVTLSPIPALLPQFWVTIAHLNDPRASF